MASRFLFAALVVVLCVILGGTVYAQDDAQAMTEAQQLFDQGVHLLNAGKYRAACRKFEASLERFDGVGTRGKLAECYEALGRVASALRLYQEIVELSSGPRSQARITYARGRIEALQPRVPRLTIIAGTGAAVAGLAIAVDERPIAATDLGAPMAVDPGTLAITARAPGYAAQRVTIELAEGASRTVTLEPMRPLGADQLRDPAPATGASGRNSTTRIVGYAVLGLGSAGVLTGLYFGATAYDGARSLPEPCRAMRSACTPEEDQVYESARTAARRSTYSFLIGGALLGTGATLWWLGRSRSPSRDARTTLVPMLAPDRVGWAVHGTF